MSGPTDRPEADDLDYVWHFRLSDLESERLYPDALTEMVRRQLKAILGCVVLTADGVPLKATGFRILADPAVEHAIHLDLIEHSTTGTQQRDEDDDDGS